GLHASATLASTTLLAIGGDRRAFEISAVADGDRNLFVRDQVFELDFRGLVFNHRAALVTVQFLDFFELGNDDFAQLFLGAKNRLVLCNTFARGTQLFVDFVNREPGQAMQLQLENRVRLDSRKRLLGIELRWAPRGVDLDLFTTEICD